MNKQQKFIANRIQSRKPMIRNYAPGTEVYYESANDEILKSTVGASGGETTYLTTGDWCYSWQLVAVSEIPAIARF